MNWPLSLLVSLISGVAGLLTAGVVAGACANWYHITTREGAAGYFIVGIALLGGIVCSILGLIIARGWGPGFGKAVAFSVGGILAIGCLSALAGYGLADHRITVRSDESSPGPTAQDMFEAVQKAAEQAEFEAIAPDAPIREWLPYTPEWQDEERRAVAIGRITARENFVSELGELMLDADKQQAEAALNFVRQFPEPQAETREAVAAAGRDIIERIRKVNATSAEQDPSYEGAADAAYRFSCWIGAARVLREKAQGDFVPELTEILELSRVRLDSHVMQQDVRRVASFYLKNWAGIEPLPGDPPPR